MSKEPMILAINPGSTSTKLAVYQGVKELFKETIKHIDEELLKYPTVAAQLDYRVELLMQKLKEQNINLDELNAVVGRGGFLKSLPSGTYLVDEEMINDVQSARYGEHASNLGSMIAYQIASKQQIPAYIVDPVVVDEFEDLARLSGIPDLERKSNSHALNIKAVSRKIANELEKPYESVNFVVAHLGSGISVCAQKKGRIIDVNNANNEGPYSPERAGGLPAYQLAKLCYSGKYTEKELLTKLCKEGGFYAYLGTKNAIDVERLAEDGNQEAKKILDGMIYQISKEIGAMATVLDGVVDRIILTGGLSYSNYIVNEITRKVSYIAPVSIVPGEEELESLVLGALRVVNGKEKPKIYQESVL